MLPQLVGSFRALPPFRALSNSLPLRGESKKIVGLPGSSGVVLAAALAEEHRQRVMMVVTAAPADAERWLADLRVLAGEVVVLYPQRESLGEEEPHYEIAGERVETIEAALSGRAQIVVTTLKATVERTLMPEAVSEGRVAVSVGSSVRMSSVVDRLEAIGYQREPTVRDVAQFAVRGGIIDVYGFGMAGPARIEWWGDGVCSIRAFDLDTQLSEQEIESVTVLPVSPGELPAQERSAARDSQEHNGKRRTLLDLIAPDSLVLVDANADLSEVERIWQEVQHHVDLARKREEEVPDRETLFVEPKAWRDRWDSFAKLLLDAKSPGHDFKLAEPPPVNRDMKRLIRVANTGPTLILCDNEGQLERLEDLLTDPDSPKARRPEGVTLALGALHGGFVMPGLTVLTDHEIFRRARRIRRLRRYKQSFAAMTAGSLRSGNYVVHLEHGIGIYRGIETIEVGTGAIEVAVIEYLGGDRLNVPIYRLDQIEMYRTGPDGEDTQPPKLDRLGGTRWRKQRERTQAAIRKMAAELIELYARRSVTPGFAFPPDTRWQRELESAFLYEDTPDQRRAAEEVKRDMERGLPMDRLVVGDVGYGKTEVAIRAAFKAVVAGKQASVLVPTTILAEQHGVTFRERMADYPVRAAVLSRFRTSAEQKQVLEGLRNGEIDIVIGTHRLLSKDVHFRSLGLLVVDEEHRFGVRHKERLKSLKLDIDVLTLTATPIPRTLHFALTGLRDMSLIETPPRDRSPVLTFLEQWDDDLIEEAIAREIDRGGQVYFVHNRIATIESIAERVRRIYPRARLAVAHGRMRERELDKVMRMFGSGEIDVLISTMIVESGLDVTNANTMIVHQAHQFGLAQLYQLRGRVGRGHRRAYCYLLVGDDVDKEAEERLKLLEHHTELGSGYRLALRDLEIRGAGNLLGAEQSGHAHQVGFDLYMRWLEDAVRALKGEQTGEEGAAPEVIFDGPAQLPDVYIPDEDAKLDFYRRLARATHVSDIAKLREELRDRFGPLPEEADRLLVVSELRSLGARLGVETVIVRGDDARLGFREGATPRLAGLTAALDEVQFAAEVRRVAPLSLRLRRLGGVPIGSGLVRAMATALRLTPAATMSESVQR